MDHALNTALNAFEIASKHARAQAAGSPQLATDTPFAGQSQDSGWPNGETPFGQPPPDYRLIRTGTSIPPVTTSSTDGAARTAPVADSPKNSAARTSLFFGPFCSELTS